MNTFRWGEPVALPAPVRDLLSAALGVTGPRPGAEPVLPEPAPLPAFPGLDVSPEARLRHATGMSTEDLLTARSGALPHAPDGVTRPASHDEVLDVLRIAAEHRIAVVPHGGRTSVVGGLRAVRDGYAGLVALDLSRLNRLLRLDRTSRTATFQAGVRGPRAEELLAAEGFTLGHFPQSFQYATLGGFAATRSSGQASAGYGRFDQMVVGLRAATGAGTLDLGRAPQSAAGPDLRQLMLGSEGAFGVLTELTLRIRPAREIRYAGWAFPSFDAGLRAVRALAQDGPTPAVVRLSDEVETAINAATGSGTDANGGCLAVVGHLGDADPAGRLASYGAEPLGDGPGRAWVAGRFRAPYLRDALLDAGALAETLETAAFWDRLPDTYAAVRDALAHTLDGAGTPPIVMCHVSHVYETGASLYFTVVAAQADDPVAQWRAAKAAAGAAIAASGATISHHHGVGRDHRPFYAREIGPAGVAALHAVKRALDPANVLNPGILLP
ncbi:FAD-binding oxidoreductase [Pseudosporangium ferrugineum]|uniref:Alkyldihydroxyacetonephosphate synthase n=1 Tax=Pseudosporangium ferrugineum TaxID=439699 RepID=A0A2T0RNT0_9ACTN|nr:FAD-binding oxidoreductase [Pseudosporangium ferrugineum]PRY22808.1 alkyldihydroxyacetonephosphate synthase [Pseudosporangium ferrugineum]